MPTGVLPRRAGRLTNLGLLALLLLAGATGVLAFGVGTPLPARVVAAAHGAAGLGLLLLVPWKAAVVGGAGARHAPRGSPPRRTAPPGWACCCSCRGSPSSSAGRGRAPAAAGTPRWRGRWPSSWCSPWPPASCPPAPAAPPASRAGGAGRGAG